MKKLVIAVRSIVIAFFQPFAGSKSIRSGMGPASEGNPTGWFH
jgi:hypothetical protein